MLAYKQFLSSDLIVTPFEVNKAFSYSGSAQYSAPTVGINKLIGQNIQGLFNPDSDPTTGTFSTEYKRLVYDSIRLLYYSNYISSSTGSIVSVPYTFLGSDESGNVLQGSSDSAGRYINYLETTLPFPRYFPTASNAQIGVFSIPTKLYGNQIEPNSFKLISGSFVLQDDGEGNLVYNNEIYGNIFYRHGIVTITSYSGSYPIGGSMYGSVSYGYASYGTGTYIATLSTFINYPDFIIQFSSSVTLYETQYKCSVDANEFNASLNPTLVADTASMQYVDFATGSYFSPYVTTVGLYNEAQDLMAVAKLAQPLPLNHFTDTNIIINIDK